MIIEKGWDNNQPDYNKISSAMILITEQWLKQFITKNPKLKMQAYQNDLIKNLLEELQK